MAQPPENRKREYAPSEQMLAKLTSWLSEQGYPLEFRTARELEGYGFRAILGGVYDDQATGKTREIDVVAELDVDRDPRVRMVISCKATAHPWLVLSRATRKSDRTDAWRYWPAKQYGNQILELAAQTGDLDRSRLTIPNLIGYSLVQAHMGAKSDDSGYAVVTELMGAAAAIASDWKWARAAVVWPVLVVSAPLIQVSLTTGRDLDVEPVPRARMLFNGSAYLGTTVLDIVHASHWRLYVREMADAIQNLENYFSAWLEGKPDLE